ncbi:putative PIF1-like helicase [Hamiltosporidium magnivora]|uniref:Putative PIF1-like helicase n=1 Tax=Hamiltosporidium magnivora TaxID=148818 RepID=A0A4Q9LE63_9MICR|nr:putative PIF1-like helicase [Hamiltosporidium magnivora]
MISKDIVKDIFGEVLFVNAVCKFSKKVILTHPNEEVTKIDQSVFDILQGEEKTYLSTDSLFSDDTDDVTDYPIEILNSLTLSGTPFNALYLKKGAIIMLLKNLNTERGIDLTSVACQSFQLKGRKFLIRLAFAMTINEAQGQILDKVGIFLPTPFFGTRQLYFSFSRVISSNDVKVYIKDTAEQGKILPGSDKIFTKNVMYKVVLDN